MSCVYTSDASRPPDKGEEGGSRKKTFFRPLGPQFGVKTRGGGGPPGPLSWIRHCIQGSLTLTDSFQSRYSFDHVS